MPFIRWLDANAAAVLGKFPEVKEYGLWIVTTTSSTTKCALNAWTSRSKEVAVGFSGTMAQVGGLELTGSWYTGSDDGGWNFFEETVKSTLILVSLLTGKRICRIYWGLAFSVQQDCGRRESHDSS